MSEFFYTYGTRTSFFVISEIHGCWIARMTEQILISGFLQEIRDIFLFAMLFLKWRSRNNSCIQYEQIRLVFEEIGLWWILFNWARVPLLPSHPIPSQYQLTNTSMIKFLKGRYNNWLNSSRAKLSQIWQNSTGQRNLDLYRYYSIALQLFLERYGT